MQEPAQGSQSTAEVMPASTSKDGGFYPIRVDARASSVGESLYDIAEKLLGTELENARHALERLWALRKETQTDDNAGVIDTLIAHYEAKVSTLRGREERVRKVSDNSRELLDRRRSSETRLAQIRKDIAACKSEIQELEEKHRKLRAEELSLTSSAQAILDELATNEREVVGALRDIAEAREVASRAAARPEPRRPAQTAAPAVERRAAPAAPATDEGQYRLAKSVVKTKRGRVLGEYCYDAAVEKEKRHYVYNTKFLCEQLSLGLDMLRKDYDRENHAELVQMLQDVGARVAKSDTLHFEIATYDIVNPGKLQEAWQQLKNRSYDDVQAFCDRLRAKLDTLGPNYRRLLKAQLDRLHGKRAA